LRVKDTTFVSSERVRMKSYWEYLADAILKGSQSNKKLNIAVNMESHENHETKYEYVMALFTRGKKYT